MYLYNIHTHKTGPQEIDGYKVRYILNTYPDEFEEKALGATGVWFSCGIHPWNAGDAASRMDLLIKAAEDKRVVFIGEAGLDKLKGPDMKIQAEVFRSQIELAIRLHKPLIIHCVKAWDELIALYKEYKTDIPWIIHGYRGNAEQTRQLGCLGFKFSIGEFFNEEAVRHIPLDSVFCETDMSELSICKVYESVSHNLGVPFEQFVEKVEDNIRIYIK